MGKCNETKKLMLELMSSKPKTLTELSKEMGLAPSTVSQHIKELLSIGAIEPVENPYIKKWKYYKRILSFNIKLLKGKRIPIVPIYNIKVPSAAIKNVDFWYA